MEAKRKAAQLKFEEEELARQAKEADGDSDGDGKDESAKSEEQQDETEIEGEDDFEYEVFYTEGEIIEAQEAQHKDIFIDLMDAKAEI